MSFKYSVVCDTLRGSGYSVFDEPQLILSAIKEAGYDGADLGGDLKRLKPGVLKPIADSIGLELPEVLGQWAFFHGGEDRDLAGTNDEARQRGIEYAKRALDLTAAVGARYFEICAAQPPIPQVPFPEAPIPVLRQNFVKACKEICDYAQPLGITILFEPLNLYEAYPGVLTSVYDALRMIDAIGYANLGVQPDVYHMNISEAAPLDALRAAGKHIKVMHMNETNHSWLGAGHGDHLGVMRTLKEIGFDGYISIYMPFISQALMQAGRGGYGHGGNGSTAPLERPELVPMLRDQLHYLKSLERVIDAQPSSHGGVYS
jgi:sugar phosphate isomerase/epimerase